jgi:hypothetical protein
VSPAARFRMIQLLASEHTDDEGNVHPPLISAEAARELILAPFTFSVSAAAPTPPLEFTRLESRAKGWGEPDEGEAW